MKNHTFPLLAIVLCTLCGGAALAADPVSLTLPYTFKTTKTAGRTYTFTFSLLDSGGTEVWTESKPYRVPTSRKLTHSLGSIVSFDLATAGPVDFSRQLTVEVRSGSFVRRSALTAAPYALWSAGSGTFWGLDGNDVDPLSQFLGTTNDAALQFKVNSAGALSIDSYDGSAEDSSPNLVAGFNAGSDGTLGNAGASGVVGAVIAGGGRRSGGVDEFNAVTDSYGVVGGGVGNVAGDGAGDTNDAAFASVAGGRLNAARGQFGFVGGGLENAANGLYGTIVGGWGNTACRDRSVVAGGKYNTAGGVSANIVGGYGNWASANYSFIGGGELNATGIFQELDPDPGDTEHVVDCSLLSDIYTGRYSAIGGGRNNVAKGQFSGIIGGENNIAAGDYASVPGGLDNSAAGTYSLAAGHLAKAWASGSFVWADDSVGAETFSFPPEDAGDPGNPIAEVADNQFWVRATGGIYLVTSIDPVTGVPTAGMRLIDGATGWEDLAAPSDRNLKTAFAPVATNEVLEKVDALPIRTWSYKGKGGANGPTHMGPTAQDFRATFDLGQDDKHIAPVDAAGVSLAAIQGLYAVVKELQATVARLEGRLAAQREDSAALRLQVADLQKRYAQLRALMAVAPGINPKLAQQ